VSFYAEERHNIHRPLGSRVHELLNTSARCSNSAKIPALNSRFEIIDRARLGARQARAPGRGPRPAARDRPGAGSRAALSVSETTRGSDASTSNRASGWRSATSTHRVEPDGLHLPRAPR
jgi:hypothetical protein